MDYQVGYDDVSDKDEYSDIDEPPYRNTDHRVGISRIPRILLQSTAAALRGARFEPEGRLESKSHSLPHAWMRAIAHNFPDTSLGELRAKSPSLLPPWLILGFESYEVLTYRRNSAASVPVKMLLVPDPKLR